MTKTIREIAAEWDALAVTRFEQMTSGADLTFDHVLAPGILCRLPHRPRMILDAGCGVGVLTEMLALRSERVIGIDPSVASIEIARRNFGHLASFEASTMEAYSASEPEQFDVVVANMVLMDAPNLDTFLTAAACVTKRGGKLIFSITHPCFWPKYYGYADAEWFKYNRELMIESPFKISAMPDGAPKSTHIHRPMETYIRELTKAGFRIERLDEPFPASDVQNLYPVPWHYPRYLIGSCDLEPKFRS